MKRSPEVLIARMRKRKRRIVGLAMLLVILVCGLVWNYWMFALLCQDLVPKEGDDLATHAIMSQSLLFGVAILHSMIMVLAAFVGLAAGALITELFMFTKTDLLLQLWDRVQLLERSHQATTSIGKLSNPTSPDQLC